MYDATATQNYIKYLNLLNNIYINNSQTSPNSTNDSLTSNILTIQVERQIIYIPNSIKLKILINFINNSTLKVINRMIFFRTNNRTLKLEELSIDYIMNLILNNEYNIRLWEIYSSNPINTEIIIKALEYNDIKRFIYKKFREAYCKYIKSYFFKNDIRKINDDSKKKEFVCYSLMMLENFK